MMKQTHYCRTAVLLNPVCTLQDGFTRYSTIGIILYQTLRDISYIHFLSFSSSPVVQKIKLSNQVERWFTIQDLFHLLYNSRYTVLSEILTSIWPQGSKLLTRHCGRQLQFLLLFFTQGSQEPRGHNSDVMHFLWNTCFKAVEWFQMKNRVSWFLGKSNTGTVADIIFVVQF